jgi:meiotic recombination protein REC8, fungi type
VIGDRFDFDMGMQDMMGASQRSSLFPWDNAGASSSVAGAPFGYAGSDRLSVDHAEVRIRGSSLSRSRRDSSLVPSQVGSIVGGVGFSPSLGKAMQINGEDFAFDGSSLQTHSRCSAE